MSSKPGLTEYRLEFSDRNGVVELSGPMADARRIQNVLFGHGRAGDYDLGVDLQSYLHEISDSQTLTEIRDKVRRAVEKYCPSVAINELVIDTLPADKDPSGRNNASLIVGFSLGTSTGKPFEFAVVARKDAKGDVVSSLVL